MSFERLWAPWRLDYVTGGERSDAPPPEPRSWREGAEKACFLCRASAEFDSAADADRQLLVAIRETHAIVILNRYPYNNGHLLVSPLRHVGSLEEMTREEHVACMALLARLTTVYRELLGAEGFNIGVNLGRVAGAGLPGHLHWHLVPRWSGDNNFMPVLAGTRVIPQSLEALWQLLSDSLSPPNQ